jgi:sugar/nucleoside kinase (ribokinase family)
MKPNGILCIGALNHDTVAIGTPPSSVIERVAAVGRYSPYSEMLVPDSLAEEIVDEVKRSPLTFTQQLGGSAFNVARVLAAFAGHLRLGFLGVAGQVRGGWPHAEYLHAAGVDTRLVALSDSPAARSIAFSADGDRTIFTSRGANVEAADHLVQHRDASVEYLASFDIVHITSFLDPTMPEVLASAVDDAMKLNPYLTVSVDPGHGWSVDPTGGVGRLLRLTSLLHVNALEFASMGGRVGNESDDQVAARVRNMLRPFGERQLVVRKPDRIVMYLVGESDQVLRVDIENDEIVPPSAVVDATGVGDTFAGGLLVGLASPVLQLVVGTRLGMALGRAKVRQQGPLSMEVTVATVDRLLGSLQVEALPSRKPGADGVSSWQGA